MKRGATMLLLAALTCAGCYWPGMGGHPDIAKLAKEDALKAPAAPPSDVKPDDITEKNYRAKLKQLDAEITYEEMTRP